jgi:serine/tyrosine/threonine adenylyltransferase
MLRLAAKARTVTHELETLRFDNRFVRGLPGDPDPSNRRRQVRNAAFSRVSPSVVARPTLIAYATEVAALLDLSQADCESARFAEVFAGNRVLPGMEPYAACYGGHQFGNWAGQLGDGRAITLGEAINQRAERWELQLKGAGPTPYSRTADGRAVLRSSVREFLCSEAMHHLGVPTTRALSLVGTGEQVVRDMFYDGHPRAEPGAVVCRVAPSFLRFGNFELPASRDDHALLRALADHTIVTHFPTLGEPGRDTYLRWFDEVVRRTLDMVVHWMRVGFVHGVMNTDNMSVLGLTIDYGPYGWLEEYDPGWTPNTTDAGGRRYRYGYQPRIALWNLGCFAQALLPLLGATEPLEERLQVAAVALDARMSRMLHDKLGLAAERAATAALIEELPLVLTRCRLDMTNFFRALARLERASDATEATQLALHTSYAPTQLRAADTAQLTDWLGRYLEQLREESVPAPLRAERMNAQNPKYVLRNYMAQLAIDKAEQGDASLIHELLELLRRPYAEQPEHEAWAAPRPEWARDRAGCSMLSCSS